MYNNGSMAHDYTADDGYHVDQSGKMITGTGWVPSDGNLYYLKDDGSVAINWQIINGNWYYFYPNSDDNSHIEGSMAENTIINGDYINNDDKWIKDYTDDDSESLFDKAKSDIRDFTMGAGYSVDNNMYYGVTTHVAGMDSNTLPDSTACKAGKVVGDIASIAGGTAEVAAGVGMEGTGIVADGTGVAVVPGLALNAAGAVVVVNGGVTVYRSTGNLANDTMSLIKGDEGGWPKKGKEFRGGSKKQRDNWYGYNNKDFQNWWHRSGKREFGGDDIEDSTMAKEVYDYWKSIGEPRS